MMQLYSEWVTQFFRTVWNRKVDQNYTLVGTSNYQLSSVVGLANVVLFTMKVATKSSFPTMIDTLIVSERSDSTLWLY